MQKVVVDCETGVETVEPLTQEEVADAEKRKQEHEQREAAQNARADKVRALRDKQGPLTTKEQADAIDLLLGRQ